MKNITTLLVIGLLLASIAPILGETCSNYEENNRITCSDNTKLIDSIVAKSFLNNIRKGSMDLNGNKLVHTVLTPFGDLPMASSLLKNHFGAYDYSHERNTPGWYSYDIQPLSKTQKPYEPVPSRIYTSDISDEE